MFAARYNKEPWKLYNPNSGVTNNVALSLNAVIKHLLNWKEVPVDCLCLSLYYSQFFYFAEIQRGMIGVGDYILCKEFQCLLKCPDDIRILDLYDPQEIVDIVRNGIKELHKTEICLENTTKHI